MKSKKLNMFLGSLAVALIVVGTAQSARAEDEAGFPITQAFGCTLADQANPYAAPREIEIYNVANIAPAHVPVEPGDAFGPIPGVVAIKYATLMGKKVLFQATISGTFPKPEATDPAVKEGTLVVTINNGAIKGATLKGPYRGLTKDARVVFNDPDMAQTLSYSCGGGLWH
jgi:hypothetical protein